MFILTGAGSLLASCFGACAMTACCTGAKELMRRSARLAYCVLFVLSCLTSWVLRDQAKWVIDKIPWIIPPGMDDPEVLNRWYGQQAVLRVSLGNFLFYGCLSALLIGVKYRSDKRDMYVHHGGWIIKLILWLLFNALPFFLPNKVVDTYAWFARIGSGLFLLVQMLILLDFTHTLNDQWVESEDERYLYFLLAATVGCYVGVAGITAMLFIWFKPGGLPCSLNVFIIVAGLLLVLAFSLVSVHPVARNGSLFPSAVIALYCSYLSYSALASEPHDYECNGIGEKLSLASGSTLALSMVGTLAAVVWSALRAGSNTALFFSSGGDSAEGQTSEEPLLEAGQRRSNADADDGGEGGEKAMDEFEPISYNYSFFHLIFALASMYIGMLMTGWGTGAEEKDLIDVGWASVWVKIGAQWLIGITYGWTLLAPALFPERDFS